MTDPSALEDVRSKVAVKLKAVERILREHGLAEAAEGVTLIARNRTDPEMSLILTSESTEGLGEVVNVIRSLASAETDGTGDRRDPPPRAP